MCDEKFPPSAREGATLRALGGHGPHHRRLAAAVMATAPSPAQQEAAKFSQICRNCAKPTAIIEDHQQGDLVCTECGLVLESRVVDESSSGARSPTATRRAWTRIAPRDPPIACSRTAG